MKSILCLITPLVLTAAEPASWSQPFPAHKIAGNIYYVGTADLGCFLVTDPKAGHILINTGLENSVPMITGSIEKLGFKVKDIRILLTNQAHYDHVAGFAELRKFTKAKVYATPGDAPLLESGAAADPGGLTRYAAVHVDRKLADGETIRLGGTSLKVVFTYGHTPGSAMYETTVVEDGKKLNFLFANMGTVVMPLSNPKYPGIVADYKAAFARQHQLHPDIWVAAHGSQYGLDAKYKSENFVDPDGYQSAIVKFEQAFQERLKIELGQ